MKKCIVSLAFAFIVSMAGQMCAQTTQNGSFNAPQIGAITCDGSLSDWSASTAWSEPFVYWYGYGLPSETRAKFAWNDATNMLYVAIQTDQAGGGHPDIGIGFAGCTPITAIGATQLAFDCGVGNSVAIMNEIQEYKIYVPSFAGGGTVGVEAGQSFADGVTTYEIAIPLWENWVSMDNQRDLSVNDTVYAYIGMEDQFLGSSGMDMTNECLNGNLDWAGSPMQTYASAITLVPEPCTVVLLGFGAFSLIRRKK